MSASKGGSLIIAFRNRSPPHHATGTLASSAPENAKRSTESGGESTVGAWDAAPRPRYWIPRLHWREVFMSEGPPQTVVGDGTRTRKEGGGAGDEGGAGGGRGRGGGGRRGGGRGGRRRPPAPRGGAARPRRTSRGRSPSRSRRSLRTRAPRRRRAGSRT